MNFKRFTLLTIIFLFTITSINQNSEACTSILVTKGASKNNSTMISYSCDGEVIPVMENFIHI